MRRDPKHVVLARQWRRGMTHVVFSIGESGTASTVCGRTITIRFDGPPDGESMCKLCRRWLEKKEQ